MNTKLIYAVVILSVIAFPVFGEGFIGGGSSFVVSPAADEVFTPSLYVNGGLDVFAPIGTSISFFANGGGKFAFYPVSLAFGGILYAQADISYRGELFYSRLEIGSYFERWSTSASSLWEQHAEVYLSLDYENVSLFAAPAFTWIVDDNAHTVGMDGTVGISAAAGKATLSPGISGGFYFLPTGGMKTFFDASVGLAFYPGLPLTFSVTAGFRRVYSDYKEIVLEGEAPLPVDSSAAGYWKPSLVFFLGGRFDLTIAAEGSFAVYDYPVITDEGGRGTEPECRFFINPEAVLRFAATDRLDMFFGAGMELLRSNSTYLNTAALTAELSAAFSF